MKMAVYLSGIYATPLAVSVVVLTRAQARCAVASTEGFETDIQPIASDSKKLEQLRPG